MDATPHRTTAVPAWTMRRPFGADAPSLGLLAAAAALAVLYAGLGVMAYRYVYSRTLDIAGWWPASGLALAVLIRTRRKSWPALVTAIFGAALWFSLHRGLPGPLAFGRACADTVEPLIGAMAIRHFTGSPGLSLTRVRDVRALMLYGALLGPVAGTIVGVISEVLFGGGASNWWHFGAAWWGSAYLGAVVFAPLLLTASEIHLRGARIVEALVLGAVLYALTTAIFTAPGGLGQVAALAVVTMLLLGWAAVRFGPPGAAWGAALCSVTSVVYTVDGRGPFHFGAGRPGFLNIVAAQLFFAQVTIAALLLAAAIGETEQLRAEARAEAERVARSERRFRSLAEATAQVVWTADSQGRAYDSPSARAFTGMTESAYRGWRWLEAVHPDDRLRLSLEFAQAIRNKTPFHVQFRVRHHSGTYRHLEGRGVPVLTDGGEVIEWVGMGFDITERIHAEQERARLYQESRDAIRLRDEFLNVASHELKTPLTPLSIRLQALQKKAEAGQAVNAAAIARARESLSRLTWLINDMLDVGRIQSARAEMHRRPVSLVQVVQSALAELHPPDAVQMVLEHGPAATWISGDLPRLAQLVTILADNACKFSPEAGVVRVEVREAGDEAILSVSDQGIGIPTSQQEHLFERFFRARNARAHAYGGLGLGLYIARDIVERHGGRIWAQSALGKGSTFYVALPLRRAEAPHQASAEHR